jgi:hypothetical protein
LSCMVFFWNQKPRISRPCCTLVGKNEKGLIVK